VIHLAFVQVLYFNDSIHIFWQTVT